MPTWVCCAEDKNEAPNAPKAPGLPTVPPRAADPEPSAPASAEEGPALTTQTAQTIGLDPDGKASQMQ